MAFELRGRDPLNALQRMAQNNDPGAASDLHVRDPLSAVQREAAEAPQDQGPNLQRDSDPSSTRQADESDAPEQVGIAPNPLEPFRSFEVGSPSSQSAAGAPFKTSSVLLPIVFSMEEDDTNKKLSHRQKLHMHWIRYAYLCVFVAAYLKVLMANNRSKQLMTGELTEALEEFFPEAGKSGERLTESEVTPAFKEIIHADDVAKTLTWFQMFCMQKVGSDDHVPWAWSCDIARISYEHLHPVPWDVINNAQPEPGSQKEHRSNQLLNFICSPNFLHRHVAMGDDPRKADFGDVEQFRNIIQNEARTKDSWENGWKWEDLNHSLAPEFDEFTVLDKNPMLTDIVEKGFENTVPDAFKRWLRKSEAGASLLERKSRPFAQRNRKQRSKHANDALRAAFAAGWNAAKSNVAAKSSREGSRRGKVQGHKLPGARIRPGLISSESETLRMSHGSSLLASRADVADDGDLPSWCKDSHALPLQRFLRKLQEFDLDGDASLNKYEYLLVADELGLSKELWPKLDASGDGRANLDEIVNFVKKYKGKMKSILKPTCRNHHWGMLPLCGPDKIEVHFYIENANYDLQKNNGEYSRNAFAEVTITFEQEGRDPSQEFGASTGWYNAHIKMESESVKGSAKWSDFYLGCAALILFALLFLVDGIYTLICMPQTFREIAAITRSTEKVSLQRIVRTINAFVDARGMRIRYMWREMVLFENSFAVWFVIAVFWSAMDCFENKLPIVGKAPNKECEHAYEDRAIEFVREHGSQADSKDAKLISPYVFIKHCLDGSTHLMPELMNELVWDAGQAHGFALLFALARLLDIFVAFGSTSWVLLTLRIAKWKLFSFFIFYTWLIGMFAMILYSSYGAYFIQFSTLSRSAYVLVLFSFGFTQPAFDALHAFTEIQSTYVTFYLVSFAVLNFSVALQFLTSIVLDAYSTATDTDRKMVNTKLIASTSAMADASEELKFAEFIADCLSIDVKFDDKYWNERVQTANKGYIVEELWNPSAEEKVYAKQPSIQPRSRVSICSNLSHFSSYQVPVSLADSNVGHASSSPTRIKRNVGFHMSPSSSDTEQERESPRESS